MGPRLCLHMPAINQSCDYPLSIDSQLPASESDSLICQSICLFIEGLQDMNEAYVSLVFKPSLYYVNLPLVSLLRAIAFLMFRSESLIIKKRM